MRIVIIQKKYLHLMKKMKLAQALFHNIYARLHKNPIKVKLRN
jgi:3-isopropylmalate dehydratase small subunit